MLFVFTQDDDGVIWFIPRTAAFDTADMPREVIENYNQRVAAQHEQAIRPTHPD